jgi:proline dehydrogenase
MSSALTFEYAMSLFSRLVVTTLPLVPKFIVGRIAARYVAGNTLDEAMATVRELNDAGAMATIDILGEEVTERARAEEAVEQYLQVLEAIETLGVDANVSVKPTMLGLKIDEAFFLDNMSRLAEVAKGYGNFLRLDMEDRTCTDATLRVYRELHQRYGNVGAVLQAYMRRTLQDIEELPDEGANVRLCKGIYVEPRTAAWKGYETVRANFLAALEAMINDGVYAAIATHDEYLVCQATAMLRKYRVPRDRYEFQMLLGVDPELRSILIERGHRLRVYVPFGSDWYQYSVRRLRENPEIAGHVARGMLGRR